MPAMRPASVLVGLAAVVAGAWFSLPCSNSEPGRQIAGDQPTHTQDSDGDGLPDLLERVVLSDPFQTDTDGDLSDDLDEYLGRSLPWEFHSTPGCPRDALRLGVTTSLEKKGVLRERVFWLHLTFRLTSGQIGDLRAAGLFLRIQGIQVPLGMFLQDPRNHLNLRINQLGALVGTLSVRVSLGIGVEIHQPFQVLGACLVQDRPVLSAAYIFPDGSTYLQLLPLVGMNCFFAALDPLNQDNLLWAKNAICSTTLTVVGLSAGAVVYEVQDAACKTFSSVQCPPSCPDKRGMVIVAPDGWSLIEGD